MGDWLGTGTVSPNLREYRPFSEARKFIRRLKLKSNNEWRAFCKGKMPHLGQLPVDIPATPHNTYADKGWASVGDWLGTGIVAARFREYRSFRKARAYVRKLGLKSESEWRDFCKGKIPRLGRLPEDIPACAGNVYVENGWKSMGDWLGTGVIAHSRREFLLFCEARAFVHELKLKNCAEWYALCVGKMRHLGKLPANIPTKPGRVYAGKGWIGMGDWLGTGYVPSNFRVFRSFRKARAFARRLKLKSETEWRDFVRGEMPKLGRLPEDIPACPRKVYVSKGWKGMSDWLGTGTVASWRSKRVKLKSLKAETAAKLDGLRPAILDKAVKGEL